MITQSFVNSLPEEKVCALLTTEQAATFLGYTSRMLEARRVKGDSPKFVRISKRAVRYRLRDLQEWIEKRLKSSTSEA